LSRAGRAESGCARSARETPASLFRAEVDPLDTPVCDIGVGHGGASLLGGYNKKEKYLRGGARTLRDERERESERERAGEQPAASPL